MYLFSIQLIQVHVLSNQCGDEIDNADMLRNTQNPNICSDFAYILSIQLPPFGPHFCKVKMDEIVLF